MAPRNNAGPGPIDPVGRIIGAGATGTSGKSRLGGRVVQYGLSVVTRICGRDCGIHRHFKEIAVLSGMLNK